MLLFTQSDHAALAAALMALWRADGLAGHPRRSDLLLAIREHDNGWQEADAAPRLDPESGRPLAFDRLARQDRIEIWRRGVRRFEAARPFVALLILQHALEIHRDRLGRAGWRSFAGELTELAADLRESTGIPAATIEDGYRFLEIADLLSLGACGALGPGRSRGGVHGYRFEAELGLIGLDPFPLAGATTLPAAYRTIPAEIADGPEKVTDALLAAPWRRLPVRVEPL